MWSVFWSYLTWLWEGYLSIGVEFCLLSIVVYKVLFYLRGTRAINVLVGLIACLLLLRLLAEGLSFEMLQQLFDKLGIVLALAVVVIFQPELRRAFAQLGSSSFFAKDWKRETIGEIAVAVQEMAERRIGAIIVLQRRVGLRALVEDSVTLDCKVNSLLLRSIFYPNSPLHDGAVIVSGDRIVAARAILPLSHDVMLSRTMGTRHRAALGITEDCDAIAVVVSEETGEISITTDGEIQKGIAPHTLERELTEQMLRKPREKQPDFMDSADRSVPMEPRDDEELSSPTERGSDEQ